MRTWGNGCRRRGIPPGSLVGQGAGEEGFAGTSGTGDDNIVVALDPVAGDEAHHDGLIDSPGVL